MSCPPVRSVRLSQRDAERLKALAAKRQATKTGVIRQLIRGVGQREGLEP